MKRWRKYRILGKLQIRIFQYMKESHSEGSKSEKGNSTGGGELKTCLPIQKTFPQSKDFIVGEIELNTPSPNPENLPTK